jgi:hypothetical protein
MTRLCLCGLSLLAVLTLAASPEARGDGGPAVVKPDDAGATPANPAPAAAAEEAPQGTPLWVWAGGAIAAALFAVGLMVRLGMNQSPPARLVMPPIEIPPAEGQPGEEYYPDDPSAEQQS